MTVHYMGNPVLAAYDVKDAVHRPCPNCGAKPRTPCTNPVTGAHRKVPCVKRLKPTDSD